MDEISKVEDLVFKVQGMQRSLYNLSCIPFIFLNISIKEPKKKKKKKNGCTLVHVSSDHGYFLVDKLIMCS